MKSEPVKGWIKNVDPRIIINPLHDKHFEVTIKKEEKKMNRNRMHNMTNPNQGKYKKILCVCSAGLLRSPTAALVLSMPPFNHNTRAVGLDADFALVVVDEYLAAWADEIVCMTSSQITDLRELAPDKKIICLQIEDSYDYRDPKLIKLIAKNYKSASEDLKK